MGLQDRNYHGEKFCNTKDEKRKKDKCRLVFTNIEEYWRWKPIIEATPEENFKRFIELLLFIGIAYFIIAHLPFIFKSYINYIVFLFLGVVVYFMVQKFVNLIFDFIFKKARK
jgi:hypothetical protein